MDCSPPGSSVHGILWSGLPFPSSGDLPDQGVKPVSPASPALAGGLYDWATWGPVKNKLSDMLRNGPSSPGDVPCGPLPSPAQMTRVSLLRP